MRPCTSHRPTRPHHIIRYLYLQLTSKRHGSSAFPPLLGSVYRQQKRTPATNALTKTPQSTPIIERRRTHHRHRTAYTQLPRPTVRQPSPNRPAPCADARPVDRGAPRPLTLAPCQPIRPANFLSVTRIARCAVRGTLSLFCFTDCFISLFLFA